MLSHVGSGVKPSMEHLPSKIPATVPGECQKPVILLLSQSVSRPVIFGKVSRSLPTRQGQACRQEGLIQSWLHGQRDIRKQPQVVRQCTFLRHNDLIVSSSFIPRHSFVVQTDQNRGVRLIQIKASIPVEMLQKNKGIPLCRLLLVQSVGQRTHGHHIANDSSAAHADENPVLPKTVPAGDNRICPCAVYRQNHCGRYLGIPILTNTTGHGRDGLYIKAGHSIAPGYLCIEGIFCRLNRIPGKERIQHCAVFLGALCRGN